MKLRIQLAQMIEPTIHMITAAIYAVLPRTENEYVHYPFGSFHQLLIAKMMMRFCWKMANIQSYALIVTSI